MSHCLHPWGATFTPVPSAHFLATILTTEPLAGQRVNHGHLATAIWRSGGAQLHVPVTVHDLRPFRAPACHARAAQLTIGPNVPTQRNRPYPQLLAQVGDRPAAAYSLKHDPSWAQPVPTCFGDATPRTRHDTLGFPNSRKCPMSDELTPPTDLEPFEDNLTVQATVLGKV